MATAIPLEDVRRIRREARRLLLVMTWQEVADHYGVSKTSLRRYLDPDLAERMRISSNAAKHRRTGKCVDCGATTKYGGKQTPGGVSLRCPSCAAEQQRVWTREEIIAAIQRWAREHDGRPPRAHPDWTTRGDYYPGSASTYRSSSNPGAPFASWAEAIEAAGFPRPERGHYERTEETRRRLSEARRYWTEEKIIAAIRDWVETYGYPPRTLDWTPSYAIARGRPDLAERWRSAHPRFPHSQTVCDRFGTLGNGIRAAGFTPLRRGERVAA